MGEPQISGWHKADTLAGGLLRAAMADAVQELLYRWVRFLVGLVSEQLQLLPAFLRRKEIRVESAAHQAVATDAVSAEKQEFLRLYEEQYGYPGGRLSIDQLRSTEFKRLEGT